METKVQTENHHEAKTAHCLNCGTEFEGKFCPECGQSAETGRFTFKFIWENLIAAILGRDGGIWFTLKNLFSRPGAMIVDILNGKRRRYFSPFPMLFSSSRSISCCSPSRAVKAMSKQLSKRLGNPK